MTATVTYTTVNGRLMMENRGGVKTAYVSDTLGNLIQCRDASGNKTYEAFYWSYGEIRASTGTNPSPWGFVGLLGYYTDALNYLYVRARYYRPNLTRWQTVDPLWPWQMSYVYARSSPSKFADSRGLCPWCIIPCAPCAACIIDLLIVCPPGIPSWGQCVQGVWDNLPTWLKWGCGIACAACLACIPTCGVPEPGMPPEESLPPEPEPLPRPICPPEIWDCAAATKKALSMCAPGPDCFTCIAFQCTTFGGSISFECSAECVGIGALYCLGKSM